MHRIRMILTAVAVAVSAPAFAQEVTLKGMGGSDTVFIWRDSDSASEAMSLINAGVHRTNPMMVARLLACTVDSGTKAIITDGGFMTQDILVTGGSNAGCRGNVPTEEVSTR